MASDTRFCTQCGAALTAGTKFCGQCGQAVVSTAAEPAPAAAERAPAPAHTHAHAHAAPPAADGEQQQGSGCGGCLTGMLFSLVALGIPLLIQRMAHPNQSPNGAFPIVALGVLAFWGLTGAGWKSGRLVTGRHRPLERRDSPIGFAIGLFMYALAGLGMYVLYLALVFNW